MHMSFYWSADVGEFFFPGLMVNGAGPFSLLCIVLSILAIGYEGFKVVQTRSRARTAREQVRSTTCAGGETTSLLARNNPPVNLQPTLSQKLTRITGQAVVFLFHTTLGYFIMLSVMVYNGYIFVIVILSMGLGYFFFGHISMRTNMENVRARTTRVVCSPRCPVRQSTSCPQHTARTGYVNEIASHSSESSSNDTQSTHAPEVEVIPAPPMESDINSCRL